MPDLREVDQDQRIDREVVRRFWVKQGKDAHDLRSMTLDSSAEWLVRARVALQRTWLRRAVSRFLGRRPSVVVDLGCGVGHWMVPFAQHAKEAWAVDVSPGLLHACRERFALAGVSTRVHFVCRDLVTFEPPTKIDLALLGAVIQYLDDEDVHTVLGRIARSLSRRGLVYVRAPLSLERRFWRRTDYHSVWRPFSFYEDAFARAGLEVLSHAASTEATLSGVLGRGLARPLARLLGRRPDSGVQMYVLGAR